MKHAQILDGKYRIERELGRGGMGAVYLATHLGTERPVAIKVIAPQFMQRTEFVERFRREARAAGRLRHPNVVNVTDFGFSSSPEGEVAYLVMEYLDGCTLGEILEEEKHLPVGWTLDILEQVCSAVHEAHLQGIIHRDLKPDNIWLEPNQRGGYTVKVLDFGIAKLEEQMEHNAMTEHREILSSQATRAGGTQTTIAGSGNGDTFAGVAGGTLAGDAATMAAAAGTLLSEAGTIALSPAVEEGETKILTPEEQDLGRASSNSISRGDTFRSTEHSLYGSGGSSELTRVGSVLGTPLYMSPEQCRGEHLDARSDVYSLGVIAYQMLSGKTPFTGDFKAVMEAHKAIEPAPIKTKGIRRKMKRGILTALHKDPDKRPQTAEAFASELRARSEGIFGLVRHSMMIYSEHLTKYVMLSGFFSIPMVVLTLALLAFSFLKVSEVISDVAGGVAIGVSGLLLTLVSPFCANLIIGTISWVVTQKLAVPLRPLRARPSLAHAKRKWKRFAGAGLLTGFLPFIGAGVLGAAGLLVFGGIGYLIKFATGLSAIAPAFAVIGAIAGGFAGFFYVYISFILVAPVVMMEDRKIIDSIKRSRQLVKRSFWTAFGAVCILIFFPALIAISISYVVNVSAKAFDPNTAKTETSKQADGSPTSETKEPGLTITVDDDEQTPKEEGTNGPPFAQNEEKRSGFGWVLGRKGFALSGGKNMDMRSRIKMTVLESINQILWLPAQILVFSFSAIIIALLYLKTRLAGGELMHELVERFEDDGRPRKKWQERVRARLRQSGRIPSRS